MLVDLTPYDLTGKEVEKLLDSVNITCNKNTIPNDPKSPFVTSGIRTRNAGSYFKRVKYRGHGSDRRSDRNDDQRGRSKSHRSKGNRSEPDREVSFEIMG